MSKHRPAASWEKSQGSSAPVRILPGQLASVICIPVTKTPGFHAAYYLVF
ncbi:MAG: hypothetical protein ACFFCW_42585 [Candidatus Hodarchaeota archaeon]